MLYLRPLSNWLRSELEFREAAPELAMFKMPFALLTSAAVVSDKIELDKLHEFQGKGPTSYKGCIIGNILDSELNYGKDLIGTDENNRTIIGIDFDGKYIKTIGEFGLRKPIPIIERIEINTDGENNALKEAQITVRCFTLKQLEMFELFYCRPGMNLLLEFGNNFEITQKQIEKYKDFIKLSKTPNTNTIDTINNYTGKSFNDMKIDSILVPKTDYKIYTETTFAKYYAMTQDDDKEYLGKIIKSKGQYDAFAGKVTNFTYSINDDATYEVSITISAGNTVSLALPIANVSSAAKLGLKGDDGKPLTKEQIILKQMQIDFNIPLLKIPTDFLKTHTFNFIRANDTKKEQSTSELRYVSLHLILEYFGNYIVTTTSQSTKNFNIQFKEINKKPTIICQSNRKIISSSEDVLYPGMLPKIKVGKGSPKSDYLVLDDKETIDARINGLEFNIPEKEIEIDLIDPNSKDEIKIKKVTYKADGDQRLANALNIFVNYDIVLEAWQKSSTRADFLASILGTINDNSFNLFNLITAPNTSNSGFLTIVDTSFRKLDNTTVDSLKSDKIYRFKVNTINSIVKAFTFEMDLGNLIAGQTVFQQSSAIEEILSAKKKDPADGERQALMATLNQNALYTTYKNADGYYSADGIEVHTIKTNLKKEEDTQKAFPTVPEKSTPKKTTTEKQPSDTEVIDEKVIKFKNGTKNLPYIFNDTGVIIKSMGIKAEKDEGTLSDFSATLVIDGLSGISCGELFRIDGIPEIYNKTGAFQVMNVKHSIEASGWDTTIEASWRIIRE
jgi:hypothetical protein